MSAVEIVYQKQKLIVCFQDLALQDQYDLHPEMSFVQEGTNMPSVQNLFEFLNAHIALDGSIHDYMFEESVCLLLRASWFMPLVMVEREEVYEETEEYYYDDEKEDLDDVYLGSSSNLRIGNRRWGDNGFVRGGRQQARPVYDPNLHDSSAGTSRLPEKETAVKETAGRRAKRALKREAAEKHQKHLVKLGRTQT